MLPLFQSERCGLGGRDALEISQSPDCPGALTLELPQEDAPTTPLAWASLPGVDPDAGISSQLRSAGTRARRSSVDCGRAGHRRDTREYGMLAAAVDTTVPRPEAPSLSRIPPPSRLRG